jgi:quinoprotein glucose dehydrogenase
MATASLALTLSAAAQEGGSVWDGAYTEEQAERGKVAYDEGCAECHGAELEGDDMSPPLMGSDFLWDWNGLSLGDLFERIRLSMPDGDAKGMSDQEKADSLAYMLQQNGMPPGDTELPAKAAPIRAVSFDAVSPNG